MTCKCNFQVKKSYGVRELDGKTLCNFCDKVVEPTPTVESASEQTSSPNSRKSTSKAMAPEVVRLAGINSIIRRMWYWIGVQAFFIGVWAGNAFPLIEDGYYGYEETFNLGMFFAGALVGVGAFAPLVFVVEALREVVSNLIKGPEEKN